jgi:hypothetical protein
LAQELRVAGIRVAALAERNEGASKANVIIGHCGKHDRATNAFADCSALMLLGTYRIPTTDAFRFGARHALPDL